MIDLPTLPTNQINYWKSWRPYVLLTGLIVVLGGDVFFTNDTAQFVFRIHFGSKQMKIDCLNRLYEFEESFPREDDSEVTTLATLPPEWTWRYLISDSNPLTRIMVARMLWNLHPSEGKYLSVLITETDNSDPFIRGAALGEFWNMEACFDTTYPILRKHLFEDQDASVRMAAFNSLLVLSRHHITARNIVEQAARQLPYEATKKIIRERIDMWNQRTDIGKTNRIDIDSASKP